MPLLLHTRWLVCVVYINYTVNSGAQVPVLLFGDCAFARYGLRGVLIIMGYSVFAPLKETLVLFNEVKIQ